VTTASNTDTFLKLFSHNSMTIAVAAGFRISMHGIVLIDAWSH
jgi:hypothetical protein